MSQQTSSQTNDKITVNQPCAVFKKNPVMCTRSE